MSYQKKIATQYYREYRKSHRERIRENQKIWIKNNPDRERAFKKKYRESHKKPQRGYEKRGRTLVREEVLNHYGGKCACCVETRYEFLAIDHINGGGNKHRREQKISNLAYWIKRNNYPDGFQVLCHNCNMAKGFYGECPHEKERRNLSLA